MKNRGIPGIIPCSLSVGHAHLRPQPMLLVPPPTHHCDMAKVHRACKCVSRVRSFVRKPLACMNRAQRFICMYGRAWGTDKEPAEGTWTQMWTDCGWYTQAAVCTEVEECCGVGSGKRQYGKGCVNGMRIARRWHGEP